MSTRQLVEQFTAWRQETDVMVLVTVVATEGSTYSKPGRQLLMRDDGSHAGLISGGCLETDLVTHVKDVIKSGTAKLLTYDMRDDADDLWGIGLGCNGMMQLYLQRIEAANDWAPFNNICTALQDNAVHTVSLQSAANETAFEWQTQPWIRLLILGAAPDAEPVARLARATGWEVTVADHREHYLQTNDFSSADQLIHTNPDLPPDKFNEQLELPRFDAIVVMSHHLETDRKYLQQLSKLQTPYLGLLGPVNRKQKLLGELGSAGDGLAQRLHGPVGLDIGADSPETIALALIAEIQSVLHE
ncbi:MAG: XdhC family protein [Gammaproteobacteria bacterium]